MQETIEIGKYILTVERTSDDVLLHYNEHTASMNLINAWIKNRDTIRKRYYVGEQLTINERYDGDIQIGCIRCTKINFFKQLNSLKR